MIAALDVFAGASRFRALVGAVAAVVYAVAQIGVGHAMFPVEALEGVLFKLNC